VVVSDVDRQPLEALVDELGDDVAGSALADVGLTSDPGICAYATSKHALVGLMRTAAMEAAASAIRVNSIHPGAVDNTFQQRIETVATGEDATRAAEILEQMIPLGRHATPEEIARTGGESACITRATLAVDGGMSGLAVRVP
jgi:NAD(P)-dependent dehydrogenase (short-subunit alcohol dehydrogenase family)